MPSSGINRGNVATTILIQAALTPVAVAANITVEQSFTIPGVLMGDQISALQAQFAYVTNVDFVNIRVAAPNAITVAYQNNTSASVTPPAGSYYIEINRLESTFAIPATAV